ncbi:MAG: hypothetical protein PF517_05555 [Salinivirgaceae bacterium]|jgi:DNA mismatch repair protein MutS|nr:hypothetical protein [Salinivirgaceae bacterium]
MEVFETDKQTIQDLEIFSNSEGNFSIFNFFNSTVTKGGKDVLEEMLGNPINDLEVLKDRLSTIDFINEKDIEFNFEKSHIGFIEHYINQNTSVLHDNIIDSIIIGINNKIKPKNEYYIIQRGLDYIKHHLLSLIEFMDELNKTKLPQCFNELNCLLNEFKESSEIKKLINTKRVKMSFRDISHFDNLFRGSKKEHIKQLLRIAYHLDAYISISNTKVKHKLGLPKITIASEPYLKIRGFFHPFLDSPVMNDIDAVENKNLFFVTGANMAGKSTFLKTIGLCVYLAHVGFPVPANVMEISVFSGLFSTINISDDINKGYSHYYSEVKRVKDIAVKIKKKKKVLVIFDELFRGTNVKDAFDGTTMVTKAFSQLEDCLFFISSHIIEVGKELKHIKNVEFKCFKSSMEGEVPIYNYKLANGISNERLGLTILKNEKIIEIIDEIIESKKEHSL